MMMGPAEIQVPEFGFPQLESDEGANDAEVPQKRSSLSAPIASKERKSVSEVLRELAMEGLSVRSRRK